MQNCMMLAYSALERKNYKDAYDHFNRAIEIDIKNPNAWFGKAVCEGRIGKIGENSIGQMVDMFESSIMYAPDDKKNNFRKNASAEIVKVIRESADMIQLACELLVFKEDDDKLNSDLSNEITNLKENVKKTVEKAQEYDPDNKDVTALLGEITSGTFFKSDFEEKSKADENSPLNVFKSIGAELEKPQPDAPGQSSENLSGINKKSGCSFVILIFVTAAAAGFLLA
jgi:tetratricopeptide (TPR) repeat protein